MRNALSLVVVASSALASGPANLATQDEVLAQAKRDTVQSCSKSHMSCEYSVHPRKDGWSVFVTVSSSVAESQPYFPGANGPVLYVYSLQGKLVRIVPSL